jgi:beta-lactamase superfamily II metal-dependent hydrolase
MKRFSHITQDAMGGPYSVKGFEFQDRWARVYCLKALDTKAQEAPAERERDFNGLRMEGVDDVTVHWLIGSAKKTDATEYIQAKLHMDVSLLNKVLKNCVERHRAASSPPSFRIVAGSCVPNLRTLSDLMTRVRNAREPRGEKSQEYQESRSDLDSRLKRAKIKVDVDFLLRSVTLELNKASLLDTTEYHELLRAQLSNHFVSGKKLEEAIRRLEELIASCRAGIFVWAKDVENLLSSFQEPLEPVSRSAWQKAARVTSSRPSTTIVSSSIRGQLEVSLFPGEASLIELPDGRFGLIDCDRTATEELLHHLARRNKRTFAFIAVTHWHHDHYSGLPGILEYADEIETIYLPPRSTEQLSASGQQVLRMIHSRSASGGVKLRCLNGLEDVCRIEGPGDQTWARITASGPSASYLQVVTRKARFLDPNGMSSIFRIAVGDTAVLIAGDATVPRWDDALSQWEKRGEPINGDALVLPHNGSKHSNTQDLLLRITKPHGFLAAIFPNKMFKLPHAEVLETVRRVGGQLLVLSDKPIHFVVSDKGLFQQVAGAGISPAS